MRTHARWLSLMLLAACSCAGAAARPVSPPLVTIGPARPASRRASSHGASAARHDDGRAGGEPGRLYREGVAAAARDDYPVAAERFGRAYELAPSLEMAFNAFRVCERAAMVDDATRWYERALTHSPPAAMRAELDAGLASLRDFARRRSEDIAQLPPDTGALEREAARLFERGVSLYRRRRYRAALGAFEAVLRVARRSGTPAAELYFNLAVTHERLGHRAEAVAAFREYLTRSPDSPDRPSVEARVLALSRGSDETSGVDRPQRPSE